ncbi:MAG: non-heme iron oxygenase ferredoxin subunit [Chloroflexi bacterium]|nr:non-heme iron oxygenase ferredoxin subunit [Chloroflexota bacterium]
MKSIYNYRMLDETKVQYVSIAPVEALPDGERLFVEIGELSVVIFNIAGEFYAIADVCSHDSGPVGDGELEGYEVICPRHGARFDIRSGEVLSLPAVVDIAAYPIRIVDGQIEIGIPIQE